MTDHAVRSAAAALGKKARKNSLSSQRLNHDIEVYKAELKDLELLLQDERERMVRFAAIEEELKIGAISAMLELEEKRRENDLLRDKLVKLRQIKSAIERDVVTGNQSLEDARVAVREAQKTRMALEGEALHLSEQVHNVSSSLQYLDHMTKTLMERKMEIDAQATMIGDEASRIESQLIRSSNNAAAAALAPQQRRRSSSSFSHPTPTAGLTDDSARHEYSRRQLFAMDPTASPAPSATAAAAAAAAARAGSRSASASPTRGASSRPFLHSSVPEEPHMYELYGAALNSSFVPPPN